MGLWRVAYLGVRHTRAGAFFPQHASRRSMRRVLTAQVQPQAICALRLFLADPVLTVEAARAEPAGHTQRGRSLVLCAHKGLIEEAGLDTGCMCELGLTP